jgi:hypothetical protein
MEIVGNEYNMLTAQKMGDVRWTYVKTVRRYVTARASQASVDSECVKKKLSGVEEVTLNP